MPGPAQVLGIWQWPKQEHSCSHGASSLWGMPAVTKQQTDEAVTDCAGAVKETAGGSAGAEVGWLGPASQGH